MVLDPVFGKEILDDKSKSIVLDETVVSAGMEDCNELPEFGVNELISVEDALSDDVRRIVVVRSIKVDARILIDFVLCTNLTIFTVRLPNACCIFYSIKP